MCNNFDTPFGPKAGIILDVMINDTGMTLSSRFDVTRFGAVGDGKTPCTSAVQQAIDACATAGGGTVNVPAGVFIIAPIVLRSRVTLHLEAGATLKGSSNPDDFPEWASNWEGPGAVRARQPLIGGEGLTDIALTGRGTIDGSGRVWWERQWAARPGDAQRPLLIRFVACSNVIVDGITLTNSPMWTLSPLACDNVTISRITIRNPSDSPNTDGINPDSCSNVHISNCHIDVGDDCITIKSGKETDGRQQLRPCQNITITNCTLVHGHGGVVVGSEMTGCVRNVVISNCVFLGTDRGIRFKARRGRGGVVEDVRASNLIMDGVKVPISINLFYGCGAWSDPRVNDASAMPVDENTPRFRRLRFSNITATSAKFAAMYIIGLPEMYCEDISLQDVIIRLDRYNTEQGEPDMSPVIPESCRAGVVARYVRGLRLSGVEVVDVLGASLRMTECEDVVLDGVSARPGDDSLDAPVRLWDVKRARIERSGFPVDLPVAVVIGGTTTESVRLSGNDYGRAARQVSIADDVPAGAIEVEPSMTTPALRAVRRAVGQKTDADHQHD
jgi:polygalacturonase